MVQKFNIIIRAEGQGMLLVQTNSSKQQCTLEEQFSREGNLFAVPVKKTHQIALLLETILFEIFGQSNSFSGSKLKQDHPLGNLVQKVKTLCQNMFKLTFSLSSVREILTIIKMQSVKIKLYEDYIMEMNRRFMLDDDVDDEFQRKSVEQLLSLEHQFQDQMSNNISSNRILDIDFAGLDCRIEAETEESGNSDKTDNRKSTVSIKCKFDSSREDDAQTMHTLKSQMTSSPKFSLTPLSELKFEQGQKIENRKLDNSFHCQDEGDEKQEQNVITNVKDQLKMNRNSMDSIFYCPEWKKAEDDQKKMVQQLLPLENKKKSSNQTKFVQNLSGRVHPVPSFLHDESIGEMIYKQKKEDVRKSNILKKSIQGIEEKKTAIADHAYSSNLRLVKFQNKLRRNSKKGLCTKKNMQQIKQELGGQQTQMSQQSYKLSINTVYSDDRLLRNKQRLVEVRIGDEGKSKMLNTKMQQIIQSKVKLKRQGPKKIQNEVKPLQTVKGFNFFKARRQ